MKTKLFIKHRKKDSPKKMIRPYYQEKDITIYNGDCLDILPKLKDESVDLIVTDPPYNLGYAGRGEQNFISFANDKLDRIKYTKFIDNAVSEFYRILKNKTALYVYIDFRTYPILYEIIGNYFEIKNCIVWIKNNFGMGQYFRFKHEFCIFAIKGNYKLNRSNISDVWNFKKENTNKYCHPTQKPKAIMSKPIEYSSNKNDIVLDPFLGSGTTLRACKDLGRKGIGIEISKEYCDISVKRLAQGVLF